MSLLLDRVNRRIMFGKGAALMTGVAAGLALQSNKAQGQTKAASDTARATVRLSASPNLQPPVVQVKSGKLRGYRDGKTFTFLGVPYGQRERSASRR